MRRPKVPVERPRTAQTNGPRAALVKPVTLDPRKRYPRFRNSIEQVAARAGFHQGFTQYELYRDLKLLQVSFLERFLGGQPDSGLSKMVCRFFCCQPAVG